MIDWNREYAEVYGLSGVRYTQDGKFYKGDGRETMADGTEMPIVDCPFCEFVAKNEMGLKSHMRVHK